MTIKEMTPEMIGSLEMDDERLIGFIQQYFLEPPSNLPYNLTEPNKTHYSQLPYQQSKVFASYFQVTKY